MIKARVTVKPGMGMGIFRQKLKLLNSFKHNPNRLVSIDAEVAAYFVSQGFLEYASDEEQRNAQVNCETVKPLLIEKETTEAVKANPLWIALKKEKDVSDMMREADKGHENRD